MALQKLQGITEARYRFGGSKGERMTSGIGWTPLNITLVYRNVGTMNVFYHREYCHHSGPGNRHYFRSHVTRDSNYCVKLKEMDTCTAKGL